MCIQYFDDDNDDDDDDDVMCDGGPQLENYGPVVFGIAIDTSVVDFFFYSGGVYKGACVPDLEVGETFPVVV